MNTPKYLEYDELYQGLTRPPMIAGVTEVFLVLMMMVEVWIFVIVGDGKGLAIAGISAPLIYGFGYVMCMNDPRVFEIWTTRMRWFTAGRRRQRYWHGSSFDPF